MATKLRVHQQHPSLSVLALGHISEIARPKRKCTGTVRHQHVPRDVPMDSLGLAKNTKPSGCSKVGWHGANHMLSRLGETSVQAVTHGANPRRAAATWAPQGPTRSQTLVSAENTCRGCIISVYFQDNCELS